MNIVGGCCGTTPAHIRALAQVAERQAAARSRRPIRRPRCRGIEAVYIDDGRAGRSSWASGPT